MNVDRSVELLWHASRVSPHLRDAVLDVERELLRLRRENAVWMNGVADAVEPLGFDREAACGPADLLPGLLLLADQVERLRTSNAGMSRHITVLVGRIAGARALIAEAKDDVDSPQALGRLTAALDELDGVTS